MQFDPRGFQVSDSCRQIQEASIIIELSSQLGSCELGFIDTVFVRGMLIDGNKDILFGIQEMFAHLLSYFFKDFTDLVIFMHY